MSELKKAPLIRDPNVKDLLTVLKRSGRDTSTLNAILRSVSAMEQQLSEASKGLEAVQRELAVMREEKNHPAKTLLDNTTRSLSVRVRGLMTRIAAVKETIVNGCKKAFAAFRSTGIISLNGLAGFLPVKEMLQSEQKHLSSIIKDSQAAVAKIETAAAQYHTAGQALKNISRAVRGKELIPAIKPNGNLARLIEAPYRTEIAHFSKSLRAVNTALAALNKLEKAAEAEKPSVRANIKAMRQRISGRKQETPAKTANRHKEETL